MVKINLRIGNASVDYYFEGGFALLKDIVKPADAVLLIDENVFQHFAS